MQSLQSSWKVITLATYFVCVHAYVRVCVCVCERARMRVCMYVTYNSIGRSDRSIIL